MSGVVSLYLRDSVLEKLDAEVERRARKDIAAGRSGRQVTSRSSLIAELIEEHCSYAKLTKERITYCVVKLAEEYGAKRVFLFGSWARGEQSADSDVDLLVEKGSMQGTKVFDFQYQLEKELGCKVDVVTTAGASERLLAKIKEDEELLYDAAS